MTKCLKSWPLCPCIVTLAIALTSFAGCNNEPTDFEVKGRVTFQGEPVAEGNVMFEDLATGNSNEAAIGQSGTYSLKLSAGNYNVVVEPPMIIIKPKNGPPDEDYKKVNDIPSRYWSTESSDLKANVSSDSTQHDFDLKP